jgi:hypothetical protein
MRPYMSNSQLTAEPYHLEKLWDCRLLVIANVSRSSPILVTLMKEGLSSTETSVLIRATRLNIPEGGILCSHLREDLKSYVALTGLAV